MGRDFRYYGRRPARDQASLLKVDDLINMALGTTDKNVIDFKMLQFILYILAGHINILEQMVELRLPRGGELSTLEEYYEDAGRVESYKKPANIEYRDRGGKWGEKEDGDRRGGKGERRKENDRVVYEVGTDEIYRRVPKMRTGKAEKSDSDIEYRDRVGKKGERKDGDESKGKDYKDRVKGEEENLDTYSSKRGRRTSDDESVDGVKVKRTRSLDTESYSRGKGQGRDEKYEKNRSRSLDSHRDKRGIQSKDSSDEYVGGSLTGDESERVSKSIDRKSKGRYNSTGDDQRRSDRDGKPSGEGSTGGAHRSRDNDEYKDRPRRSCDTGAKRIPTKRVEDEDETEGDGRHRAGRAEDSRAGRDENIEVLKSDGERGGKGRRYMEDGGSVGKGRVRETNDKGKEHGGRDSVDDFQDGGRSGSGKRKGEDIEDVERGGTRGRKVDTDYEDERRGKKYGSSSRDKDDKRQDKSQKFQTDDGKYEKKICKPYNVGYAVYFSGDSEKSDHETGLKYVDHEFPAQPRPRGKSEDVKSTGMSSDDGKGSEYDEKYFGPERRGDDYEKASERRGKKGKDAKGIASKGTGRGDKDYEGQQRGRGKDGYDDEDEDDTEGRGGAGARSGKPGVGQRAADKDAAGRKKGEVPESSITSVGSRGRGPRVGSIEMVTQDQFNQLERAVKELQKKAGPMAAPLLPENSTLLMDISKGAASLTDVIQALQIQARLQAAERAIERMTDLISQLAAAGALTPEALARIADIRSEFGGLSNIQMRLPPIMESHLPSTVASKGGASLKGRNLQESSAEGGLSGAGLRWKLSKQDEMSMATRDFSAESMAMAASKGSSAAPSMGRSIRSTRSGCVTPDEMREAISAMREQFMEKANRLGGVANQKATTAEATSKTLAEKVTVVLKLNNAVTEGYSTVNDYAAVMHGFDCGIETQLASYNQQLNVIRDDLREGLIHLDKSCNNAETRAILDLREDINLLKGKRDDTRHTHRALTTKQEDLDFKVKDLMETVELLREIKVDKDEVEDALKDKADLQRINAIVTDEDFNNVYTKMQVRLQMCFDKFRAQDTVWTRAAQELNAVTSDKCDFSDMESTRNKLQQQIQILREKARTAAKLLEDPKVAVLARRLYKESTGAAKAPTDVSLVSGATTMVTPQQTYRSRTTGDGAEDDVCGRPYIEQVCGRPYEEQVSAGLALTADEDDRRSHICKRWCGGSHTLVNETVTRDFSPSFPTGDDGTLRRCMGQGTDNKLYMMAYSATCNCNTDRIPGEAEELTSHYGAGDQGGNPTIVTGKEARRVTIVCDTDLRLMRVETGGRLRSSEPKGQADYRPLATGTTPPIESQGFKNKVGVVVQGRFTVVDEESPIKEAGRRTSLAEERILDQLATVVSNVRDSL